MFLNWCGSFRNRNRAARRQRPRPANRRHITGCRPRLECLEDRTVPGAGALDPTFGTGGLVTTQFEFPNDEARAVALQADGKIVAAGTGLVQPNTDTGFLVVRYNTDGSLDDGSPSDSTPGDSFGSGGKATVDFEGFST